MSIDEFENCMWTWNSGKEWEKKEENHRILKSWNVGHPVLQTDLEEKLNFQFHFVHFVYRKIKVSSITGVRIPANEWGIQNMNWISK